MTVSIEDFQKALKKAMNYACRSEKCFADVLRVLKNFKLSDEQIKELEDILIEENFINHERYAKAFANDKFRFNKWGRVKIYHALIAKKISSELINKAISQIDNKEYLNLVESLAESKIKSLNTHDTIKLKQSLLAYLYSKGFEREYVEKALKKLNLD